MPPPDQSPGRPGPVPLGSTPLGPALDWEDGVPVSRRFGDPYFSREGGLDEARHVVLGGTDLPARLRPGFRVLELGFGTGLNFRATLLAFRAAGSPGPLLYTAFEAFPLCEEDRARALAAFGLDPDPDLDGVELSVIEGDARATLPAWEGAADAVILDGFAPARNPEMWEAPLLAAVAARMAPGARLATYTAAGHVRRALAEAGLTVERRPGFGAKRHMTVAWRP